MRRAKFGQLITVVWALLCVWAGQGMIARAEESQLDMAFGATLIVAGLALFVGVSQQASHGAAALRRRPADLLRQLGGLPPGIWLLAGGLLLVATASAIAFQPGLSRGPSLLAWLAGMLLFLAACRSLRPVAPPDTPAAPRYERWEWAALVALTIAALALRIWRVGELPASFGGDEGEMGLQARGALSGVELFPFATGWLSHPMLWFFLQAGSLAIFGDTVFGLRALSALLGAAAVPALYAFARPLYGRAAALSAAALLAAYHFHIHFSRLGANNIADPLVALVAFAAFMHGLRRGSPLGFGLAGVTMGIGMHFYMGARLAPVVVAFVLLHQLIFARSRMRALRLLIAAMALGFLLGFGPLLRHYLTVPENFAARLNTVGVFQSGWYDQRIADGDTPLSLLHEQAAPGFGVYTLVPDRSAWYDPRMPLLDQVSATLFLLGLALTVARPRRPESALLVAWLAGAAVFGGMLIVNLESPRFVTTAPALCLLIAVALGQIGALAQRWVGEGRRVAHAAAAVGLAALALWNVNFYFREYTPRHTYGWITTEAATAIGQYLRDQPPDTFAYIVGPPRLYMDNGTVRFIAPRVQGVDVPEPLESPEQIPPLPDGMRPVFIFLPERAGELEVVRQRYPDGHVASFDALSEDSGLYTLYEPK